MTGRHSFVARPCRGLAVLAVALAGPAPLCLAAPSEAPFVLAAQPLESALMELARQSGSNILFMPGSMARLMSRPVRARGFDEALRQMLAGLPVRVVQQSRGMVIAPVRVAPRRSVVRRAVAPPGVPPPTPVVIVVTASDHPPAFDGDMARNARADDIVLHPAERPADRNLAEAFAHAPGVLVLATNLQGDLGGIDRAGRAEGQFLAIRGLGGAYAAVRVDGVDLPQSLPFGRDAELGMLSTMVFDKARISATPGPQEAGDATSALVDLATPSAFAEGPGGLRLSAGTDLDTQAMRYHQPAASWQAGLRYTRRLGDAQQWGVALGATVSRRVFAASEQTYQTGTVELKQVTSAGTSPAGVNPASNLLLTGLNLEFTRGTTFDTAVNGALEWHGDALKAELRVLHATSHTDQDVYQLGLQGGDSAADETLTALGNGVSQITSTTARVHYWYQTNPENSQLTLAQFKLGSAAGAGPVSWQARFSFAQGMTARPRHIETSFWGDTASQLSQGLSFTSVGGYPQAGLGAADTALANGALNYPVHLQAERRDEEGRDRHWGFEGRLGWRPAQGALALVEGGLRLDLARRGWWQVDVSYSSLFSPGTTLAQSGLVEGQLAAILPGVYNYSLPLISESRLAALIAAATPDALTLDEANGQTLIGREFNGAGYLRAVLGRGRLTVQPGVRLDISTLQATYWLSGNNGVPADGVAYGWNRNSARFAALLPSLFVDWRPSPAWQWRAGLWTSTARPAVSQLSGAASLATQSDGSLLLTEGNPDLKAMRATNLDLSGRWQDRRGARVQVGLFAKWLAHYIYDAGADYANALTTTEDGVTVSKPMNGGLARLWGAEVSAQWPLALLSRPLRGFSLGVTATGLVSRVRLENPLLDPVEHLQDAPAYNVSVELGWARGAWSARLAARWTGAYLQQYGLFGRSLSGNSVLNGSAFDIWVRPARRVDLDLGRRLGRHGELRLFVENLLADAAWRSTMGLASYAVPQTITAGRQMGLKVDYAF